MSARLAAALLTFAEGGRGIAWLPRTLAADSLKAGRLMLASDDEKWATPVDVVLYRPAGRLTGIAEALWSGISRGGP